MKKTFTTTLFTLAVFTFSFAQGFQASTYMEQTHISPKFGTSLGYEFGGEGKGIEVGGFFQRSAQELEAEAGRPMRYENEFYGAFFAYPILDRTLANIKFNVRTGVSNGQNFVITPSVMANFTPLRNISLGGGVGTRAFRPTYMATLKIKLNTGGRGGGLLALNQ